MLSTRLSRAHVLVVVLAVLHVSTARADDAVDKARDLLLELRFEEARDLAQKALQEGNRKPKEVAAIYMVIAEVSAALGDESEARAQFRNALAIDSSIEIGDGVSPKIVEPFEAARAMLEGTDGIGASATRKAGEVTVVVDSDPARLIEGARVTFTRDGKKQREQGKGSSEITLEVPEGASSLKIVVVDRFGNVLGSVAIGEAAEEPEQDNVIEAEVPTQRTALWKRWQLWAGVSVVFLAGGAYFGNESVAAADKVADLEDGTEFSVAKALEDDAKRNALYANIGFAAAGVLVGVATWMYFRQEEAIVVPVADSDSVGAAAVIRF